jgi:predicted Rossmann fold nucleotide-binding protein DprA/Smf involved in DNA uptake
MTEKIKVTIQDKFAATIALFEGAEPEIAWTPADAVEFLQDRAEKAKSKPRERKVKPEVIEFRAAVAEFVASKDEPVTAKAVAEAFEVSTQKASAALRALVAEGEVIAHDGEKARDAKTYEIAR